MHGQEAQSGESEDRKRATSGTLRNFQRQQVTKSRRKKNAGVKDFVDTKKENGSLEKKKRREEEKKERKTGLSIKITTQQKGPDLLGGDFKA